MTRVALADDRAGVMDDRGRDHGPQVTAGQCRPEQDLLATDRATVAIVLMQRPGAAGRRERWSWRFGLDATIFDAWWCLALERTQQFMTRCMEQRGQCEQEVGRERAAGSVGHEVEWSIDMRRSGGRGR